MKIRTGFVSNSSSSSFVVVCKEKELTSKFLLEKLRVDASSPMFHLTVCIAEIIEDCITDTITTVKEFRNYLLNDGVKEEFVDEIMRSEYERELKDLDDGFCIHIGSFSDDEGDMEAGLCNTDWDFEEQDFKIWHEGGY